MEELFEKIDFYNNNLIEKGKNAKEQRKRAFEVIEGQVPIIISAPHCVQQLRNGKIKSSEGETGAIVQYLAEKIQCYAIYKTYNNNDDANYDIENNPYKEEIMKIVKQKGIKLLLDLHGANYTHDFDIDIGTGEGKNLIKNTYLVEDLKKCFIQNGIKKVVIDQEFKATSEHTISRSISEKMQIPCIQIEINGKYRHIQCIEGIEKLVKSIESFVNKIKETI